MPLVSQPCSAILRPHPPATMATSPELCPDTLMDPEYPRLDIGHPQTLCTPSLGLALRGQAGLPSPGLGWSPKIGKDDGCGLARCGTPCSGDAHHTLTCSASVMVLHR